MKPIPVKEFNLMQAEAYKEYSDKCHKNGIEPEPANRYFPQINVKYGYVVFNHLGHFTWKPRKKYFDF